MALIVDSAVYIDFLRAGVDIRQRLLPVLRAGELYNCGIIRAEVVRGIRNARLRQEMEQFFDVIPEVVPDARLWRQVTELGWDLGRQGKWPPVTDLAIAACTLRVRARLISPDKHFRDIPGLDLTETLD